MSQKNGEPIIVRTTRLNNLIVGKGVTTPFQGIVAKGAGAAIRRSLCGTDQRAISTTFGDAINRDGLLDALILLYTECDKETLKKRDRNINDFVNKYRPIISETRRLRINSADFEVKALIGKGYFGTVHLVNERATGDVYAMKTIKKPNTPTTQKLREERDIMCQRKSDWITHLQYAFQDDCNVYLVMEYLPGGDLLSLMSRNRPFPETVICFYLAEMTEAINALHSLGYVHRDIKPENILIDRSGHLKLADFGNAAALNRDGNVLSMSPVGTPDYIAPELLESITNYKLTKSLHDVGCDYWSMGIIAYELVFDFTPFYSENVHDTYSQIMTFANDSKVQEMYSYPKEIPISKNLRNLIDSLVTNSNERLNYTHIKAHTFFENIEWKHLRQKVPPLIPTVNDDSDISNFETREKKKKSANWLEEVAPKPSAVTQVKTNDFSGQHLPYLGLSFVFMDDMDKSRPDNQITEMARSQKLQTQLKELQEKFLERNTEISKLKSQLLAAERLSQQNARQKQMLEDYKQEICNMKDLINEKTVELAESKTVIKVLDNTVRIDEENWEKNEATIAEMLAANRRKYEEAKLNSEEHYEKQIAEKNNEIKSLKKKLEVRETESLTLSNDKGKLLEKVQDLKTRLEQSKRELQSRLGTSLAEKCEMVSKHDKEVEKLRETVQRAQEEISSLSSLLRSTQKDLREAESSLQAVKSSAELAQKNYDETINRLNSEVLSNIKLCHKYMNVEEQLVDLKQQVIHLQTENGQLERELQVAECSRQLSAVKIRANSGSPYETANGSMSELHETDMSEKQLRIDLEQAQKSEQAHKNRATQLEEMVEKLEAMIKEMSEKMYVKTKEHDKFEVENLLERQNVKLEDKLQAAREELVLERQSARTANLNAWKLEKQLEEARAEQKVAQRRFELMEYRLKSAAAEHDNTKLKHKQALGEIKLRDDRLQKLEEELQKLKEEMQRERLKWTKCEEELMANKSEVVMQFAKIKNLETSANEAKQNCQKLQAKYEELAQDYKRAQFELKDEQVKTKDQSKEICNLQANLRKMQRSYQQLKEACHITDTQLTEVEELLHKEQARVSETEAALAKMEHLSRKRSETISELNLKCQNYEEALKDYRVKIERANKTIIDYVQSEKQLKEQLSTDETKITGLKLHYLQTLQDKDILKQEAEQMERMNENRAKELQTLKDENTQLLTQLFYAKEKANNLQTELETLQASLSEQRADIEELHNVLTEKEQFYLQRNIKADTIISQQKKLIDYLQIKVDDSTNKPKKTFVDRLFGVSHAPESSSISISDIESHILYRTLQAELVRERQQIAELEEKLKKSSKKEQVKDEVVLSPVKENVLKEHTQSNKAATSTPTPTPIKHIHDFQLVLNQLKSCKCIVCLRMLYVKQYCFICKGCKEGVHKKCRIEVDKENVAKQEIVQPTEQITQGVSVVEVDEKCMKTAEIFSKGLSPIMNATVLKKNQLKTNMVIHCALEIEEQKVLLMGTDIGLVVLHLGDKPSLTRINLGMETDIRAMAISTRLAKILFVTNNGQTLYQCDYRQLESRCRSIDSPNPLTPQVIDLNISNRSSSEPVNFQRIFVNNETLNPLDSKAIAITAGFMVILKYDESQKFSPVRAINIDNTVVSVLFTCHTAILASSKFYELDLETYVNADFLDKSDETMLHTENCHPVCIFRLSQHEFMLCFMEIGIFVDEFGCRSRPNDLNWENTPTGFFYAAPLLYIGYFHSIQVMRLTKSFTKTLTLQEITSSKTGNLENLCVWPVFVVIELPFVAPTILAKSGFNSVYMVIINESTEESELYILDGNKHFQMSVNNFRSLGSMSSIATSLQSDSTNTNV